MTAQDVQPGPSSRTALHAIGAHVLARRRFDVSGRFGLRAAPGGIATPTFGDEPETVRISGVTLVREVGGHATRLPINGSTLRELAGFVQVDLEQPFSCGDDTPPLGAIDTPVDLEPAIVAEIAAWFDLAWHVLDDVLGVLPSRSDVATIQLWPEHFDAATTVTLSSTQSVNLGFSPGDGFESEPYLYVGPWGPERPGDPGFWNVPFGAMRRRSEIVDSADPSDSCRRFFADGLRRATTS